MYETGKENLAFRLTNSMNPKESELLHIKLKMKNRNFAIRFMNSMNSNEIELLYIKYKMQEQTLRFALGINELHGV